ncbi:unnamed protein product, partial [Polarella glacialis]
MNRRLLPKLGSLWRRSELELATPTTTAKHKLGTLWSRIHWIKSWRRSTRAIFSGAEASKGASQVLAELHKQQQQQHHHHHEQQQQHQQQPPKEGSVLAVRIERLSSEGHGVGRCEATDWTVMVFGALPGELVRVEIGRNLKHCSQGRLVEVIEPSESRVEPKCKHFGSCGGCQYQHLAYSAQLEWKRRHVQEALARHVEFGLPEDLVQPTVASPLQYGYRTKITPHLQLPPAGNAAQHRRRGGSESW